MSIEVHVFMEERRVPSREAWQRAVQQLAFPLVLDQTLGPRRDTGFRPVLFNGHDSGFEFYLDPPDQILSACPHIRPSVRSRGVCASFRWGGDLLECAAALSAAAALATVADGIYYDPQSDVLYTAVEAVEAVRAELGSIEPDIGQL